LIAHSSPGERTVDRMESRLVERAMTATLWLCLALFLVAILFGSITPALIAGAVVFLPLQGLLGFGIHHALVAEKNLSMATFFAAGLVFVFTIQVYILTMARFPARFPALPRQSVAASPGVGRKPDSPRPGAARHP